MEGLAQYYMRYVQSLHENPVLTKSVTSGVLSFLEEFSSQALTLPNGYNFQPAKMFKLGLYGAFVNAPLSHYAYLLLDKLVPGTSVTGQVLQLVASNAIILPIQTYVYISALGLIDDKSFRETQILVKKTLLPILITSWKYFPIVQLLVFRYVPQILWVPTFNLIALLFGIYVNATTKKTA